MGQRTMIQLWLSYEYEIGGYILMYLTLGMVVLYFGAVLWVAVFGYHKRRWEDDPLEG